MIATQSSGISLLHELIKKKDEILEQSLNGNLSAHQIRTLYTGAICCFAFFGMLLGASHGFLQTISSGVKLPILFITTTLVCLPALYVFLSLIGLKQTPRQIIQLTGTSLAMIGIVLIVLSPVAVFFLLTTDSYSFYKLTNVSILAIAGFTGIRIFLKSLSAAVDQLADIKKQRQASIFLKAWMILFGIVGAQLSFAISPFFGYPGHEFILFTDSSNNFFIDLIEVIINPISF